MDLNKKSLKEFNKIISKRNQNVNIEKLFENDNYLIQTLKRTKRILLENPAEELETKLDNALQNINKNITLLNDPEINEYNTENNLFKKNYTAFLKTSENSNSVSLHEIINHYLSSGYKIPILDFDHNLFKVNPLIEENLNKMTNYFLTENRKKLTQNEILQLKSMMYLNKLNNIVGFKNRKRRESQIIAFNKRQMKLKEKGEKEEIKKLKESIAITKKLLHQMSLKEKNQKNLFNYGYRKSEQIVSSFKKVNTIKKLNSFKEHPLLQKKVGFKNFLETKDNSGTKLETSNNTTEENNENNESINNINNNMSKTEKTKTLNQPLRDYLLTKANLKSTKNAVLKRNQKMTFPYDRSLTNKTTIPNLPIALKTDVNFYKKKKYSHKTKLLERNKIKEDFALFSRTQVKDKKLNKYYSSSLKKKKFESRNKTNNININPFSNKTEFFDYTYRRLKRGDFEDIKSLVKKYLSEIEGRTEEEIEKILLKYDYKNFKVNLKELEIYINKKEIDRKTEKIYLNNFISKRISRPLESMRKKEEQISRLNKIITAIGNHSE